MIAGSPNQQADFRQYSGVAIAIGFDAYGDAPYHPSSPPPEYPFDQSAATGAPNPAYDAVRESLRLSGMDADRYGKADWNPLGDIIKPGDTVVLKPNFVRDFRESSPDDADCVITHGAIIRAALDYAHIALQGTGRLIVADAPQNDCDFDGVKRITRIESVLEFYERHAGRRVELIDLRPECAEKVDGVIVGHTELPGDPAGFTKVNLGLHSAFAEINHLCHLLYGSEYDRSELHSHQHDDVHEYLISRTILDADVVIGLPKLKTHKKVGLTVNLKNLVGINGNKNWLPHHREGTVSRGGDQFADERLKRRIERVTVEQFKRFFPMLGPLRRAVAGPVKAMGKRVFGDTNTDTVRSGNWFGNDTTWRMVLDLNRILMYADGEGRLHDQPVRRFFSIVDGIVAGEGNGPMDATPKKCGVVIAGENPAAVDLACARLMGFDFDKLPMLVNAFMTHVYPLVAFDRNDVISSSNQPRFDRPLRDFEGSCLAFRPHFGWRGNVEIESAAHSPSSTDA